jgi:hypothetical protein
MKTISPFLFFPCFRGFSLSFVVVEKLVEIRTNIIVQRLEKASHYGVVNLSCSHEK